MSVISGFHAEGHKLLAAPLAVAILVKFGQVLLRLILRELLLPVGILEAPTLMVT